MSSSPAALFSAPLFSPAGGRPSLHPRTALAVLVTLALLMALAVAPPARAAAAALPAAPIAPAAPAAKTAAKPAATGPITLAVAASPAELPPGGSQVTLTYTVRNTSTSRAYYSSLADDKCPSPRHVTGMRTDSVRWYLDPGKTATFTCDFFAGITMTATSTATFTTSDGAGTWAESTASASIALPITQDQCSTLWSSSVISGADTGRIGTVATSGASAMMPRWSIADLTGGSYDSSAAFAIDPRNPETAYFIPSRAGSSYGGLWRLNLATGAATRPAPAGNAGVATSSVRLAMGRDGTLWSWNTDGVLWSLGRNTTAWERHTVTGAWTPDGRQALTATAIRNLGSGDLVVSGGGNIWMLAANTGTAGVTHLLAVSDEQASKPESRATYVGQMNRPASGGFYNGLAFGTRGELYASAGSQASTTAMNTLYRVDMGTGRATAISSAPGAGNGSIGDLGSCAEPRSRLQVLKRASTEQGAVQAGDEITYRIEVTNLGTLASVGAALQDAIPAHTTYVPGSTTLNGIAIEDVAGAMPYAAAREIHGTGTPRAGHIPDGETAVVQFTVRVNDAVPTAVTRIENSATVADLNNPDGKPSDDPAVPGASDPTTVPIARPAIGVTATVAVGGADGGNGGADADRAGADRAAVTGSSPITYRYEVVNLGQEPLAGIVLTDEATRGGLPAAHTCASPALSSGDEDRDLVLDQWETWIYTCTNTLAWTPDDGPGGTTLTTTAAVRATGEVTGRTVAAEDSTTLALAPQPATFDLSAQPGVAAGPDAATGEIIASSSIVVHNAGQLAGTYAPILAAPAPPPGMRVLGATWLLADHEGVEGAWDGSGRFEIDAADLPGPGRTLEPGETHRYRVRQVLAWDDARVPELLCENGGGIRTTSSFTDGTDASSDNDTACVDAPHPPRPEITLTATGAAEPGTTVGSRVSHMFTVTNTSALVFLHDVAVRAPRVTDLTCPVTSLAPGAAVECTGTVALTRADLDAATLTTTATASATPAGFREPIAAAPSTMTLPLDTRAAVALETSTSATGSKNAGDVITFSFRVTNQGDKPLLRPTLSAPAIGVSDLACGPERLATEASASCEASYTITDKDVDRGRIVAVATVAALGEGDPAPVVSSAGATVTDLGGRSGLWLEKYQVGSIIDADGSGDHSIGDTLWYNFQLRNLSDEAVTNVAVVDSKAGSAVVCDRESLAPWESTACRLTEPYRLTEPDIIAGEVINTARATTIIESSGALLTSNEPRVATPVDYEPRLEVTATAGALTEAAVTDDTPAGPSKGDTLDFAFTVTNPTAVGMTGLELADEKGDIAVTCDETTIAARATVACRAENPYVLTRADVDARGVERRFVARAVPARGTLAAASASASTPVVPLPRLAMDKTHAGPADGTIVAGDTVTFAFTLTNQGAGMQRDLRVVDPMLDLDDWCTTEGATLEPGQSLACTPRAYTVTQRDVDLLGATNVATAQATVGPLDAPAAIGATDTDVFTTITPEGRLELTKYFDQLDDVDASGGPSVGDVLRYRFEVANPGTATLRFLSVDDERIGLTDHSCGNRDIEPGGTLRCTAPSYTLTAGDLAAGTVVANDATAEAVTYQGLVVTADSEPVTTDLSRAQRSALTIAKSAEFTSDAGDDDVAQEGDEVRYAFRVANEGTVGLANLEVVDPLVAIAGAAITCEETALAAGQATTCSSSAVRVYDAGLAQFRSADEVVNVATAAAQVPSVPVEEGSLLVTVFSAPSSAAAPMGAEGPGGVEGPGSGEGPGGGDGPGTGGTPGDGNGPSSGGNPGSGSGPGDEGGPSAGGNPGDADGPTGPGSSTAPPAGLGSDEGVEPPGEQPGAPGSPGQPGQPGAPGQPGTPGAPGSAGPLGPPSTSAQGPGSPGSTPRDPDVTRLIVADPIVPNPTVMNPTTANPTAANPADGSDTARTATSGVRPGSLATTGASVGVALVGAALLTLGGLLALRLRRRLH